MQRENMSAILLTTEAEIRYFTGFFTQFWQSPTRPWFLVIPASGKPIAVIPEIGRECMARTWISDIRTWASPHPDDDGIGMLADTLREAIKHSGSIGLPMGRETHLRMPVLDFRKLQNKLNGTSFVDATDILFSQRHIKSESEIAKIAHICGIASDAFAALPGLINIGMSETEIFREFKIDLLRRGADDVSYLVGATGAGGYRDIISPPGSRKAETGDILILDTGSMFDGYFCDFDRNYAFGKADDLNQRVYKILHQAIDAGLAAARPGASMGDLFRAMACKMEEGGFAPGNVGRMGHGLGMQLTESPSIIPFDETILKAGMVMTLEPGLNYGDDFTMVHEENILIQDGPPRLLSRRADQELPIIKE